MLFVEAVTVRFEDPTKHACTHALCRNHYVLQGLLKFDVRLYILNIYVSFTHIRKNWCSIISMI
jgi:hypothetical protein